MRHWWYYSVLTLYFSLHAYHIINHTQSCNCFHTQEKLKNVRGEKDEIILTPSTENLLSKVNNSSSCDNRTIEGEKKANSGAKLHQLLDMNPRTDAVAASWYAVKKPVID